MGLEMNKFHNYIHLFPELKIDLGFKLWALAHNPG